MNFKWLPNALTIARCVFAVLCFWGVIQALQAQGAIDLGMTQDIPADEQGRRAAIQQLWYQFALLAFLSGALTDFLDGWLARKLDAHSRFGVWLDPIADKLLVSAILLLVAADGTIAGWSIWAAIIILCREILVSGLREYLAALKVSVPVTWIAKWKTTLQMVALGFLLAGPAGDKVLPYTTETGIALLWIAAIITIYTGYDYFRAGLRHVVDE